MPWTILCPLGDDAVLKPTTLVKILIVLVFTSTILLLTSSSLPVYAVTLELPYPKPYLLINDSIVGVPIGAGNTLFILSVNGEVYANNTLIFKTFSPPSTLDFDPNSPILAIGTKMGEIAVVNGSSLVVYTQAFTPIESIWLLDGSRYVAVLAGSRVLVYQLYKGGWYEISPYKSAMVLKHFPLKVEQMIAAKKVGGSPANRIAIVATPSLFKQVLLELSGLGDLSGRVSSVEIVVPEYNYNKAYKVAGDGIIRVEIPIPVKRFYIVVHVGDKYSIKIVDLKSYKYELESPIHVKVDVFAYGECPDFKGTGVLLFDAELSNISSLWIPLEEVKLLGLFEDKDKLILIASKGKKLVVVVEKDGSVEVYTYLLPAEPTCVNMFDPNYIFVGCANGGVFVIDATNMKLVWSGLFSSNGIAWLSVASVGEEYIISVVDDSGRLVVGALTDKGIVLTGYAELKGLPKPLKRVELWQGNILLSSEQGYVVVVGAEKLTSIWGDLAKRAVKNIKVTCVGEKNEIVEARVLVYYKDKLVSKTVAPGRATLLINENHTFQIIPLKKHYVSLTKTVKVDVNATSLILLVPYKYYDVVVEVYDDYGVQGRINIYVNGSLVASLEGRGQSSAKVKLGLKYGCYNITLSGPPIYQTQSRTVCIKDNLRLSFDLVRMPATLLVSFDKKPVEKMAVKVYYGDKLVAERVCIEKTCSLDIVRGHNAMVMVESLEEVPYYKPERFYVDVLHAHLSLLVTLKPKQYEVKIVLQDPLGQLLCPVEVYLDGKRVGVAEPGNPTVKVRTAKGVHKLTIVGLHGNLRVYSEEREIVVRGPQISVVDVTRIYTPINVTVVDSFTGKGPLEDIVLLSGNYSVVVNKSAEPAKAKVYVLMKKPVIVVQESKIYSEGKVNVNLTEEKLVVKLIRKIVSAQVSVLDDRGNPLDAEVVVKGIDIPYHATVRTTTGVAVFSVPVGVYEVCAQAPFYEGSCRELDLAETLELKVMLRPTLIGLVLRNAGILIVLGVFAVVGLVLYKKRRKIVESFLGGEEELF